MKGLKLAVSFLTIYPVQIAGELHPGEFGRAAAWFPIVGLLLGMFLGLTRLLLGALFSPVLAAALLVALWAALTGGLHLDGLADCFDGLLAAVPPERRLEILRDPRLGAFGGIGLALHLLLKTLAVASLPAFSLSLPLPFALGLLLPASLAPLLLAPALARWLILPVALQPMARPGGLGAEFALGLSRRALLISALIPLGVALLSGPRGLLAAALAALVAAGLVLLALRRLGGLTGDVLGLVVELAELVVLLTFAMH